MSASLPSAWTSWLSGALAYRPLFGLVALSAGGNLLLLARAGERPRRAAATMTSHTVRLDTEAATRENSLLGKLVVINAFNGLAIGLTGPLISYWFALRFRVGPAVIAPMMAATFVLTGLASIATGKITERIGVVRSVVRARLVGLVLMLLLPFLPVYSLASAAYLLRSAFNRGSAGARQALVIGLVREERRGLASSLNTVSFQLPQSIGPTVAGYLLGAGLLTAPFFAAAALQAAYLVAYGRAFRACEEPSRRAAPPS